MIRYLLVVGWCTSLLLWQSAFAEETQPAVESAPATVIWDGRHMAAVRTNATSPEDEVRSALDRLRRCADEAMSAGPFTVTAKETIPPSGDVHDYLSYSRYWWPNPETEDGLPYVRRDGDVNRKLVSRGDRVPLGEFVEATQALSLAYYFFADKAAGERAVQLVQTWFLDPETHMNPNLNFGQAVPGRADGRAPGIIDTRGFMLVLDSLALLDESVGWTTSRNQELQVWFRQYGQWLRTSKLGTGERSAANNHGSWYDAQVARYAVFAADFETARATLEAVKQSRLDLQFNDDCLQPAELKRTLSLHYCMFNLSALVAAARIGDHPSVGVDLWSYTPTHGCGLHRAHAVLVPYIDGTQKWDHQQISPYRLSRSSHLALRFVSQRYGDPRFQNLVQRAPVKYAESDFAPLLAPRFAGD